MPSTRRLRTAAVIAALASALLGACAAETDAESDQGPALAADAGEAAMDAPAQENRDIVTTGRLVLVTEDVSGATQEIIEVTEAAGGRVEARHESDDEGAPPSAELTIRVPAESTSATVRAFDDLGTVRDTSIESTDVTGTARDLDARILALQTSVTRLEGLMANAATTADLLAAEAELTARQSDLEALQSERALLADQVAMSTLTITITATEPAAPAPRTGFLGGLAAGWSALKAVTQALSTAAGAFLPWIAIAIPVWFAVRWLVRRRRSRRPEQPSVGPPMAPPPLGPATAAPPMAPPFTNQPPRS